MAEPEPVGLLPPISAVTTSTAAAAVSKLALKVWKDYKRLPSTIIHQDLCGEIASLHIVLKEVECQVARETALAKALRKDSELAGLLDGCRGVLDDLKASVPVGGGVVASGQAEGEDMDVDMTVIRARVVSMTTSLIEFNAGIMGNIEQDEATAFRSFMPSASPAAIATQPGREPEQRLRRRWTLVAGDDSTSPTAVPSDISIWRDLSNELQSIGVSAELINDHRDHILRFYKCIVPSPTGGNVSRGTSTPAPAPASRPRGIPFTSNWRPLSFLFNPWLIEAAKAGDVPTMKSRLRFVSDIDVKDPEGYTALQWAAANGHTGAVLLLITKGADVTTPNLGSKALNLAAQHGHVNVVRCLLDHNADVDAVDPREPEEEYTPLLWASSHGHADVVEVLLSHGATTHLTDDDATDPNSVPSALFTSATNGHAAVVHLLLAHAPTPATRARWERKTLDMTSGSSKYQNGMVQVLLRKGAGFINTPIDHELRTPLHIAVDRGNPGPGGGLVTRLLAAGADIDRPDICGMTALHKAVRGGRAELVLLLLERGADIHAASNGGSTALHMAVRHPPPRRSAFDDHDDDDGGSDTAAVAGAGGNSRIVEMLLEHGADVFREDNEGKTPLDYLPNEGDPGFTAVVYALLLAEMERPLGMGVGVGGTRGGEVPRAHSTEPPLYEP